MNKGMKVKWKPAFVFLLAPLVLAAVLAQAMANDRFLSDSARLLKVDAMYAEYRRSFPEVSEVSSAQALRLMEEGHTVFVDVREPEEQRVSMLPGAITHEAFLENPSAYADYHVIGYCTISYRSGKLAQRLKKIGIHMVNLRGGILAWLHAGGKVYKEDRPVKKVHVYGKKWDLAPLAYESVR